MFGEKCSDETKKGIEIPFMKNVGFVNEKWTEILVEDEEVSDEIDRHEIKKAIIQMMKKEENYPLDNWTDKFMRVNHKTYVSVEVAKNRHGLMIYTPLIPTEKPKISFGAQIRTPSESDCEDQRSILNDITEVEIPSKKKRRKGAESRR